MEHTVVGKRPERDRTPRGERIAGDRGFFLRGLRWDARTPLASALKLRERMTHHAISEVSRRPYLPRPTR